MECRVCYSRSDLNDYLDWPGVGQIFCVHRRRWVGPANAEVLAGEEWAYGITSLGPERASAERLLELTRGHWGIENGLHRVKDATMGEDGCRVRLGQGPLVLASIRSFAVSLFNALNEPNKAAALRRYAIKAFEALKILQCPGDF
jgi:hypothetical protein